VDRRFLGLLLMIGIASTAAGALIFARGAKSAYSVIENEYPIDPRGRGYLPLTSGTARFQLGILLNKPAGRLTVSFATLVNTSYKLSGVEPQTWGEMELQDKASHVALIGEILNLTEEYLSDIDCRVEELDVVSGEDAYRLVLFDFSNTSTWSSRAERDLPLLHGVLFDGIGNISGYFRGSPGFPGWPSAVQSISVKLNSNETKYAPMRKDAQMEGTLPLDQAPHSGTIELEDLKKNDLLSMDLVVDPGRMGSAGLVVILRIHLNGLLREVVPILLHR